MKERPNLDKLIDDIQKMIDENQRSLLRYVHVGTLMDILYLLKEQKAVNPVVDVDKYRCSNCGHKLEEQQLLSDNVLLHEQFKFCPECGRMVKWDA